MDTISHPTASSVASSVEQWLEKLPAAVPTREPPVQNTVAHNHLSPLQPTTLLYPAASPRPATKKRKALIEVNGNSQSMSPWNVDKAPATTTPVAAMGAADADADADAAAGTTVTTTAQTSTPTSTSITPHPRKRRLVTVPSAIDDDTPRARPTLRASSHFSFDAFTHTHAHDDAAASMCSGSASRSSASLSASLSPSKARSGSPTKRIGDLQLLERTITYVSLHDTAFPVPAAANLLIARIKRIATGRGLVPQELQDTAQVQELITRDELGDYNLSHSAFSSCADLLPVHDVPPQMQGAFSAADTLARVTEIIDAAALCEGDVCSESAWNSEVHSRLLGVALKGWRTAKGVSYMDITTARIDSATSLPGGLSKMVDYALILVPDYDTHKIITSKLRAAGLSSINHTKAEYVRFKPITVSIETKRPGMDEDGAKVQLGVWAGAHFERLQLLLHRDGDMGEGKVSLPILPEVVVQGHDWRLKIAEVMDDGNAVLHGDWSLGDTRTTIGVYKILAAIKVLADWSAEEYRAWFLKQVLGL